MSSVKKANCMRSAPNIVHSSGRWTCMSATPHGLKSLLKVFGKLFGAGSGTDNAIHWHCNSFLLFMASLKRETQYIRSRTSCWDFLFRIKKHTSDPTDRSGQKEALQDIKSTIPVRPTTWEWAAFGAQQWNPLDVVLTYGELARSCSRRLNQVLNHLPQFPVGQSTQTHWVLICREEGNPHLGKTAPDASAPLSFFCTSFFFAPASSTSRRGICPRFVQSWQQRMPYLAPL